jgi:retron-type reverse transcriptase
MECSKRRKVHSLIDKVYDPANLAEAWKRVRENKGGAGIDGLTVAGFEQRQDELLERLHKQLREKTYRPSPVKRVAIPKLGGGTRNFGIPSVRDRVVQQARLSADPRNTVLLLEAGSGETYRFWRSLLFGKQKLLIK